MATPHLTKHTLPGELGPILVDVRSAGTDTPRPAVLIVHGFKGFKDWGMFPVLADRLARAGFTAVSFNVSGSGVDESGEFVWPERFGRNTFTAELSDMRAVLDALGSGRLGVVAPATIALVGHSRGGGMGVLLAAGDPRIRVLVTWAAISHVDRFQGREAEWRTAGQLVIENVRTGQKLPLHIGLLDDIEQNRAGSLAISSAAGRLAIPWLIIHGSEDQSVKPAEAERLYRLSRHETTQLLKLEGASAGHTFGAVHPYQGSTPALDQLLDATLAFLMRNL